MIEHSPFYGGYKFLVQTRDSQDYYIPNNYNLIYVKNDLVLVESIGCKDSRYDIGIILKLEIFYPSEELKINNEKDKIKKIYCKCNNITLLIRKLNYEKYIYNLLNNLINKNYDKKYNIKLHGIVYEYDEKNLKIYYSQIYSNYRFEYKYIVNYLFKEIKCRIDFIKINDKKINDLIENYQNFSNILTDNLSIKLQEN